MDLLRRLDSRAWARVGKLVAVFGFLLPWVLISCSGTTLASASGLDMAIGAINFRNPLNGQMAHESGRPNWLVLLALGMIAGGFGLSFLKDRTLSLRLMAVSAILALACVVFSVTAVEPAMRKAMNRDQYAAVAGAVISVKVRYGYHLTWLALLGASGAALFGLYGGPLVAHPRVQDQLKRLWPSATSNPDPEEVFWEGARDANDEVLLREYLIRYPAGRFSSLAGMLLERIAAPGEASDSGLESIEASDPAAADAAQVRAEPEPCLQCGEALPAGATVCEACGAPVRP